MEIKLASTRECDTYSIVKQQRIRGACANEEESAGYVCETELMIILLFNC